MNYLPYFSEDFADFWQETAAEAKSQPLDFSRTASDRSTESHSVEKLTFRGFDGVTLYGWIALPREQTKSSAFLWLPYYGRESVLPDEFGTRTGYASLSFNFHGHEAFHREEYRIERGYFSDGADDPYEFIFRRMFQNAYIAAKVLQAQFEVDENRIGCAGMSQGAGISIWMGAWCPIIKAVCADMPFFGAMNDTLARSVYRYPLKELTDFASSIPLGMERILHTASYFDTLNQAAFCKVPTQVTLGEKDPSCRPDVVSSIFDSLPGNKRLFCYEVGHDWFPDMIPNNHEWFDQHLGRF